MTSRRFILLPLLLAVACSTDAPVTPSTANRTSPLHPQTASAALNGERTLVVDDNASDCPNADYETIQDAVDAAESGATILVCGGTYNERVVIPGPAKNGIRLVAKGAPGSVVLDGNNRSPLVPFNHAFHVVNASGVLIEGFTVREYFENIKLTGGGGNTVRKNHTTDAGHDGIFALNSANNVIEHNVSFDNPSGNACGVNIAGPDAVGNLIRHNRLINNMWGIRIQGGATNNVAFGNESRRNRDRGIINIGAATNGTTIENNDAHENPVGIEVNGSSGVQVLRNSAFDNEDFDLVLSGAGVNNQFVNNHCRTSSPDGLCAHTRGASR